MHFPPCINPVKTGSKPGSTNVGAGRILVDGVYYIYTRKKDTHNQKKSCIYTHIVNCCIYNNIL